MPGKDGTGPLGTGPCGKRKCPCRDKASVEKQKVAGGISGSQKKR